MKAKMSFMVVSAVLVFSYAGADLIRVEVTGHVTETPYGYYDDQPGQYPLVNIGDTMTGYCIYDMSSPDLNSQDYIGEYVLSEIVMQVGAYTFTTGNHTVSHPFFQVWAADECYEAWCPEQMDIYVNSVHETWGGMFKLMDLCNAVNPPTRPLDDSIPTSFTDDLSVFSWRNEFTVVGNFINIEGVLDTVDITVIPEPMTLSLLGLGGLTVVLKRNRKRVI